MIRRGWYYIVRGCVWLGLRFYFKKVVIKGAGNIPKQGPIVFTANHQNAFLDALILATTTWRYTHYVVRADVFRFAWARWWLATLNMMPIYRIRDGRSSLHQNKEIFQNCNKLLSLGESLLIFPEGNHGQQRRLRQLSKGFTRIVFSAIEAHGKWPVYVIPVGLNYTDHQASGSSVSIYFGAPIDTTVFHDPLQPQRSAQRLKEKVTEKMKRLITHVDNVENYDSIINQLQQTGPNYLDPVDTNQRIESIGRGEIYINKAKAIRRPSLFLRMMGALVSTNNLIPLGLWHFVKSKIKDPVFIGSLKFCTGLVLVPVGYILQSSLVYFLLGSRVALVYALFSLATLRWRNLLVTK